VFPIVFKVLEVLELLLSPESESLFGLHENNKTKSNKNKYNFIIMKCIKLIIIN